jgi:hypothetical protein
MVLVILIFSCVLLLAGWILFNPVRLIVNTDSGQYEVFHPGTMRVQFQPGQDEWVSFYLFGVKSALFQNAQRKQKSPVKGKKSRFAKRTFAQWQAFLKSIWAAIHIRKCYIDVDTDDMVCNAVMIPFGVWTRSGQFSLTSNFQGRVQIDLDVSIRTYMIFLGFVKFLLKK